MVPIMLLRIQSGPRNQNSTLDSMIHKEMQLVTERRPPQSIAALPQVPLEQLRDARHTYGQTLVCKGAGSEKGLHQSVLCISSTQHHRQRC